MNTLPALRTVKHTLSDVVYGIRTRKLRKTGEQKRLVIFYLYADVKKYPQSLAVLEQALGRLHGFDVYFVAINNFDESSELREISDKRFSAPGDNSQWEFSGWKRGVRLFNSLNIPADLALFVNDSFMNLSCGDSDVYWFRNAFNSLTLKSLGNHALGHVYRYPADNAIKGWDCGLYLQTHAFVLPFRIISQLQFTYLRDEELERLIPSSFSDRWFTDDDRLSAEFKEYIIRYLTCEWHSRRPFNAANWPILRGKTIAMINERLLSQDIVNQGCSLSHAARVSIWKGASRVESVVGAVS